MNIKKKVSTLITNDQLEAALDLIKDQAKGDVSLLNEVIVLTSQINTWKKNARLGIADNKSEKAQITLAILELADQLDAADKAPLNDPKSQTQGKSWYRFLFAIALLLTLGLVSVYVYKQQTSAGIDQAAQDKPTDPGPPIKKTPPVKEEPKVTQTEEKVVEIIIEGMVYTPQKEVIAGVQITGPDNIRTVSDSTGYYQIKLSSKNNNEGDRVKLYFSKAGYEAASYRFLIPKNNADVILTSKAH